MTAVVAVLPRILVLFGVGALALLAVRHRPDIAVLTSRLRTWAGIAVVFLGAVALGRAGVVVLATACGLVAAIEYGRLALPTPGGPTAAGPRAARLLLAGWGVALPLLTLAGGRTWLMGLAVAMLSATAPPLLSEDVEHGVDRLARTCLGIIWVGAACAALAVLPLPLLPLVGVATATADIGGFVGGAVGSALRRGRAGPRRLAPRLSPGKTVDGLVGSAVLATVGVAICASAAGIRPLFVPVVGIAVALACTWGDLLESLLKRSAGAKDAGAWLPGFGGLLDRIDSLLLTAPLAWLLVTLTAA